MELRILSRDLVTARSASDVVFQARQELTRHWWQQRREGFDLSISQLVLDEAAAGDPTSAADRLRLLERQKASG